MTRDPAKLEAVSWRHRAEIVSGDLLDPESLDEVFDGIDRAFYLVHSMDGSSEDFGERDRRAAANFSAAANKAGLRRIVYLGGLGTGRLSTHLASRQEVGGILGSGGTLVTELRAAVIIGSGSVSFEMLRYLTEVLPIMVTPKWVRTLCQPIAIRDILEILLASVMEDGPNVIYEIGGPDRLSYEEMMRVYAEVAGLPRRVIIRVPILSPRLSSHWIGLVTPLPTGVAKPLVDSLTVEVTVDDNSFAELVAAPLIGYRDAVSRALSRVDHLEVATRWSGASANPAVPYPGDPDWSGGTVEIDEQVVSSTASPEDLYWAFSRIGGDIGYYTMNWAWKVRGHVDSLVGGVGLRRGRRHPEDLHKGESVDFWRVASVVPGRSLDLYAEMRLPGEAWLSFRAEETGDRGEGSVLTQTALFRPHGLLGRLYWWAMFPFHWFIFKRTAQRIVETAERRPIPSGD
jgi:uncharacterized protein YbjT (DUF2867 family)